MKSSSAVIFDNMRGFRGYERGLVPIAGKPMIEHVLEAIPDQVSDIFIAVDGEGKAEAYRDLAEKYWAEVVVSSAISSSVRSQIDFAVSTARTESVLVLPCDTPLLTREFTNFLLEATQRFSAVLPRNQARETLYTLAAYQRAPILEAMQKNPRDDMDELLKKVRGVLYLSSSSLRVFDDKLSMFIRVSSPSDVVRVENILKRRL